MSTKTTEIKIVFKSGAILPLTAQEPKALELLSAYRKFMDAGKRRTTRFIFDDDTGLNTLMLDFEQVAAISANS